MIESKTILIVEDERIVAEDISEILGTMGCFICGIAANGQQAIDLANEFQPDLVLMDIVLQGEMDGVEAATHIQQAHGTPIIFLTAYSDRGVVERAKNARPAGYIVKPFDDNNLRSTVEVVLHRTQVEKSLTQSREWLITGLRSIQDGVIAMDNRGQIEFMNRAAEQMIGTSSMSAYGIALERLNAFLQPDQTMLTASPVAAIIDEGIQVSSGEFCCRNRETNRCFPIEYSAAPIMNADQNQIGVIFIFRDIAERKRAETIREEHRINLETTVAERTADLESAYQNLLSEVAERKRYQHKLNSQISMERLSVEISSAFLDQRDEHQPDAISANLHKLRQFLDFDVAAIMQVDEHERIAIEFLSLQPSEQHCGINQLSGIPASRQLISAIRTGCYEWQVDTSQPEDAAPLDVFLWEKSMCSALFVPMDFERDRRILLLGMLHGRKQNTEYLQPSLIMIGNIFAAAFERLRIEQDRRQLQAQLIQSQKMEAIGKLSGGIAHDFNNLLVPIIGYSEMLLDQLPAASEFREEIAEINRAADAASMLTRQMLSFSRKQILSKTVWDLSDLLQGLERMLNSIIGENIQLTVSYPPGEYHILADYGQIQQVLMNLCVNARDAMPDGGSLDVEMTRVDDHILVSVTDTGKGISATDLNQIFEPFYSTKGKDGTGLGLSVVYGIVEQHQGSIHVTSTPNKGTSFFIKMPCTSALPGSPSPQHLTPPSESEDGNRRRILLVEDETGVLRFMQYALEEKNYIVETAVNLKSAIERFDNIHQQLDLVLTDAILPDGNGMQLIEHAQRVRPGLGMILCSGYTDKNRLLDLAAEREITFLQKPFNVARLYQTVHEVIAGLAVSTIN